MTAVDPRHPRAQAARHRPRRRRRVRRQDRRAARGDALRRSSRRSSANRSSGPRPARSRCWPPTTAATRSRTSCSPPRRTARSPASTCTCYADMGAYLGLVGPGVPILGAFMFNAIYKFPALPVHVHERLHHQDAHRRLPRRRPPRGHVRDRADDGRARRRARTGPDGAAPSRTGSSTRSSRSPRSSGLTYDTRQLRAGHRSRPWRTFDYAGLRREQEERRASGDPVQLGIGISTFTEMCGLAPSRLLGSLAYGAGGWEAASHPDAGHRQGRGDHRRLRRTGRATRRRSARSSPTSSACRSRTSRSCTATPRSRRRAWTPTARGRWSSAASRSSTRRRRSIAKAKKLAAHLLEASEDDIEFADGTFTVRGTDKGMAIQEVAFAAFTAHDYPEDMEPSLDSDAVFDPENFSFPHGTHLARRRGRHRDRARRPAQVRLRGRRRQRGQPADRRGPGARRPRAGHRAGAVRGGQLRRPGHAGQRHVRRLHAALGGRPAQLRHGDRLDPGDVEPAGRQGRRRGGHDRLDPGHRQRRARRGAPVRRQGHRDADAPRSACGGPSRTPRATPPQETPVDTHSPGAGLGSIDPNNPQGEVQ